MTKQQFKNTINRIPLVRDIAYFIFTNIRFKDEIQLLHNRLKVKNNNKSIIYFSSQKTATQYIGQKLRESALSNNYVPISLNGYAFNTNLPFAEEMEDLKYKNLFKEVGCFYYFFTSQIQLIDDYNKFLSIFIIRDPRDILVSEFYSNRYSHAEPPYNKNKYSDFMKLRQWALNVEIDEYVKQRVDVVRKKYESFISLIEHINEENILVEKYENMIQDQNTWFTKVSDFCSFKKFEGKVTTVKSNKSEGKKHSNNRKGIAGDYKNKLSKDTIDYLNNELTTVLEYFNYEI